MRARTSFHAALMLGLGVFFVAHAALAKDLYVDGSTGDDSVSYAQNDASNPWATLGRAVWGNTNRSNPNSSQAAQAGDVVIVRAGVYSTNQGTGERYEPIYNTVNSGRPGSPITIRAEGAVTLRSNTNTGGEPILGSLERSYIVWDGFIIDEANVNTTPDTGPTGVWGADNITLQNLTIRGISAPWSDNHNSIRIELSSNVLIRNNRLSGNRGANNQFNGSAIMLYDTHDVTIEHNEIFDSEGGIFIKSSLHSPPHYNIIIRYNLLYDLHVGITHAEVSDSAGTFGARTYQNIVRDCFFGIVVRGYTNSTPANVDIVNNTIYGNQHGLFLMPSTNGYEDIVVKNNIVANNGTSIQGEDISDVSQLQFSHNLYSRGGTLARIQYNNYSLAGWQTTFAQDRTGSFQGDPAFMGPNSGDFRLGNNSPARNAGVDVLNLLGQGVTANITMGAYVTGSENIGLTDELAVATFTRPSPPVLE